MGQEVRCSIPGLAATISDICNLLLQVAIWPKYHERDLNPQNNQPTNLTIKSNIYDPLFSVKFKSLKIHWSSCEPRYIQNFLGETRCFGRLGVSRLHATPVGTVMQHEIRLDYWLLNVTFNDISVIHVIYSRAPTAIRVIVFFNVPIQAPTWCQPFYG